MEITFLQQHHSVPAPHIGDPARTIQARKGITTIYHDYYEYDSSTGCNVLQSNKHSIMMKTSYDS